VDQQAEYKQCDNCSVCLSTKSYFSDALALHSSADQHVRLLTALRCDNNKAFPIVTARTSATTLISNSYEHIRVINAQSF